MTDNDSSQPAFVDVDGEIAVVLPECECLHYEDDLLGPSGGE